MSSVWRKLERELRAIQQTCSDKQLHGVALINLLAPLGGAFVEPPAPPELQNIYATLVYDALRSTAATAEDASVCTWLQTSLSHLEAVCYFLLNYVASRHVLHRHVTAHELSAALDALLSLHELWRTRLAPPSTMTSLRYLDVAAVVSAVYLHPRSYRHLDHLLGTSSLFDFKPEGLEWKSTVGAARTSWHDDGVGGRADGSRRPCVETLHWRLRLAEFMTFFRYGAILLIENPPRPRLRRAHRFLKLALDYVAPEQQGTLALAVTLSSIVLGHYNGRPATAPTVAAKYTAASCRPETNDAVKSLIQHIREGNQRLALQSLTHLHDANAEPEVMTFCRLIRQALPLLILNVLATTTHRLTLQDFLAFFQLQTVDDARPLIEQCNSGYLAEACPVHVELLQDAVELSERPDGALDDDAMIPSRDALSTVEFLLQHVVHLSAEAMVSLSPSSSSFLHEEDRSQPHERLSPTAAAAAAAPNRPCPLHHCHQ